MTFYDSRRFRAIDRKNNGLALTNDSFDEALLIRALKWRAAAPAPEDSEFWLTEWKDAAFFRLRLTLRLWLTGHIVTRRNN